jgi:hypothetical protein
MIRRFSQPIVGSDSTLTEPRDAADEPQIASFSITTVQSNESLGQCQPSPLAELNNDSTVNNDSPPAPAVASVVPVVVEGE